MSNSLLRWFATLNYPSYIVFFVTARCNASCKMCFYKENMLKNKSADNELSVDEYDKISRNIKLINILGISGGEPFLRGDLSEIIKVIYKNCYPLVVDLPTNGFFVGSILKQTEEITKYCKNMVVDLQLSIDGPEKIHNEIRGLKDSFAKVKETYKELVNLKNKYKNLRVKACVVYSHYNQEYMEELFEILDKDFNNLDRVVFSVAHGSVSNQEVFDFNWDRYFMICNYIKRTSVVRNISDFYSIFTIAMRIAKNYFLKEVLEKKDMYRHCGTGKKVVVINEVGDVFPCEPLWYSVGNLRDNNYELDSILNSNEMISFHCETTRRKCNCHWGLPLSNSLIYKPKYYPLMLKEMFKIIVRSKFNNQKVSLCHLS